MEQNKDQSGAITLERAGFKLASHVATPGGPMMACVTDVYEKDGVQLIHSYAMGGESWSVGAAVRGEAVAPGIAELHKLTRYEYMGRVPMEASGGKWFKVADVFRLFERQSVSARAADAPSEPSELLRFSANGDLMQELENVLMENNWRGDLVERIRQSRAADALDSQPTEPDGLPPLPEPIEVGGEGWDFDDFKSEKTFSCEHMWAYARAAIASSQPTDGGVRNG